MRAPTPTGAAEMAVPNIQDVFEYLNQVNIRLNTSAKSILEKNEKRLSNIKNSSIFKNPKRIYEIKEQMFDIIYEKLIKDIKIVLENKNHDLKLIKSSVIFKNPTVLITNMQNKYINLLNKLEVLNPITTLKRGYSVTKLNNNIITSIKGLEKGNILTNQLSDGYIESEVIKVYEQN